MVIFLIAGWGWECYREWAEASRKARADYILQALAVMIELFRESEGHYPASLSELPVNHFENEMERKSTRQLVEATKHDSWNNSYQYLKSTNGFTLSVSGPKLPPLGWFGEQFKETRYYQLGKVLK